MAERLSTSRPSQQQRRHRKGMARINDPQIRMTHQLRILQVNVEGYSKAKGDILAKLTHSENIDILALQETHLEERSIARLTVPEFEVISFLGHARFGIATLIKRELVDKVEEITKPSTHCIGVKIGGITIYNVYKPPSQTWEFSVVPKKEHPVIYVGDFNSHHTRWGYCNPDPDGVRLADWADINNHQLIYDAKDKGTFTSRTWGTTNPDLCFVSSDRTGRALPTQRTILNRFTKSQHRPVVINVGLQIPILRSTPIPRWNLRKAHWDVYREYVEKVVPRIPPSVSNYERFSKLTITAARKAIPIGARKTYIPGWSDECQTLLDRFNESEDYEIAETLTSLLDEKRRLRWLDQVESLDFSRSSRKSWNLLHKLGGAQLPPKIKQTMNPEKISAIMSQNARIRVTKRQQEKIRSLMRDAMKDCAKETKLAEPVTVEEIREALHKTQQGKAAGTDEILPEFLKNLGDRETKWLADLFTNIIDSSTVPKIWKEAKIIAVPKPGKSGKEPTDYRPISLLCTTYKLFERVLLARLGPVIDNEIPIEQAGFRTNRSCCDQVLSLTTFIERSYQHKSKTGVVLLDLSSAYDTVWVEGLLLKLARTVKCYKTLKFLKNMLIGRRF